MKGFIAIIIAVAVILFAGYLYWDNFDFGPAETAEDESVMENDAMMEDTGNGIKPEEGGAMMVFDFTGRNFAFSEENIRVKKGDRVIINFESVDGFHDWTLPEFDVQVSRVNTGGLSSAEFVADKTGEFEFYCSVGNHRALGMQGKLIVEE